MHSDDQAAVAISSRTPFLLLLIWLLWSAIMLAFNLRQGTPLMVDPDDFMRMAEVRDWMSGQSWFDVTQYRINPPEGGPMHWSRLLDVPIAAMITMFMLFVSQPVAEHLTTAILPLMLLGLLMWLIFRATRILADDRVALLAAFLVPTYPLIIRQFMPGRVDHHGWQIIMAALAMLALFDRSPKRGAVVMAFALSVWMHISIEGLPYAVMFGGLLALSYLFPAKIAGKSSDLRLFPFMFGLAAFSILIFATTQSTLNWNVAHCDAVSWPLLAALTVVGVGLSMAQYIVKPKNMTAKAVMLSLAGLSGAVVFLMTSDSCALDPFGNLSPLVREYWHDTISEGLPIYTQDPAVISLLLFVPMLAAIWMAIVWRSEQDDLRRKQWLMLGMLVMAATLLSFKVQRTAGVAELFALPAIAALTILLVQRITSSPKLLVRVVGSAFAVIALTPIAAFVAGNALMASPGENKSEKKPKGDQRRCDLADLNRLPPGLIFTTMAAGPEILYRTRHSVYVSGYHRNYVAMDRLIAAMVGPAEKARPLLDAAKIDYVVFCPDHFEAQSYTRDGKQNFAASLMSSAPPQWLQPIDRFPDSAMRVYRYRPERVGQ